MLQEQADGPAEGAASKELLLVEFADLLNARSKEAQEMRTTWRRTFRRRGSWCSIFPPMAAPYAMHAAEEGVCVRKAKGDAAFFTYGQEVYSKQAGLTPTTLQPALDAAAMAAGADAKSVANCSATPETKAEVEASIALAAKARCGPGADAGGERAHIAAGGSCRTRR